MAGGVRHNGTIIAWDLDADVYVRKSDKQKTYRIFEQQNDTNHFWNPRRRTALVHTGPTLVHELPFVEMIFWEVSLFTVLRSCTTGFEGGGWKGQR